MKRYTKYTMIVKEERVQRTMKILKWLDRATRSLAQNVSVDTSTVSVGLTSCILYEVLQVANTVQPSRIDSEIDPHSKKNPFPALLGNSRVCSFPQWLYWHTMIQRLLSVGYDRESSSSHSCRSGRRALIAKNWLKRLHTASSSSGRYLRSLEIIQGL